MRVLGEHGLARPWRPGKPAGVAREAYLLGPSLTGVLTRMERDGLISRCRCPDDARALSCAPRRSMAPVQTLVPHHRGALRPGRKPA
ncbi:MAG: MarR family transcriptional regulator, partial [Comamonadaceae bacterium]|nr:MarR family transcriptional regulator [Comamonadaceae bacterium]